jgi:hypothetical protein
VAELKLKSKNESEPRKAVFTFTYKRELTISLLEASLIDHGLEKTDFKGRTDQDLVEWIRKIINEFYEGDPMEFVDFYDLYRGDMVSFDIKLEK